MNCEEWSKVAKEYEDKWNFPHCVGAIDGKHIMIQLPINSGSEFINYKGTFSVVLMALVDANYCFLYTNIGCQGRISDGGVFRNTSLFKKIEENKLMLPPDQPLPSNELPIPYIFVADDAFAFSPRIMKPYSGTFHKGCTERAFNYRLSRARRVVENVFGIMSSVFRVLRKPMLLEPNKVSNIAMTCALLHNFFRKSSTSKNKYTPQGTFDIETAETNIPGSWRQDQGDLTSLLPLRNVPRKPGVEAKRIRNTFAEYFTTVGKVPWQDKYC